MGISPEWRPCCGNCRSESLETVSERPLRGTSDACSHHMRCRDCGAGWDGSALTAEEIADRPPKTRPS